MHAAGLKRFFLVCLYWSITIFQANGIAQSIDLCPEYMQSNRTLLVSIGMQIWDEIYWAEKKSLTQKDNQEQSNLDTFLLGLLYRFQVQWNTINNRSEQLLTYPLFIEDVHYLQEVLQKATLSYRGKDQLVIDQIQKMQFRLKDFYSRHGAYDTHFQQNF